MRTIVYVDVFRQSIINCGLCFWIRKEIDQVVHGWGSLNFLHVLLHQLLGKCKRHSALNQVIDGLMDWVIWVTRGLKSCSMLSKVMPSNPYDSFTIIFTRSFKTNDVFWSFSNTGRLVGSKSAMLSTYLRRENSYWKDPVIFVLVAESAELSKSMSSLVLANSCLSFW